MGVVMKRKVLLNIVAALLIILLLLFLQRLFSPKYVSKIHEGNLVEEYYKEEKNHDVIFVGDCEVFSNISPITLWEKYGVTSYIRGSAQQLIWQSYYLLEETLKYEKPKVVVFNVLAMKYNEPQNEAYNRMTLDGMKFSPIKLKSISASLTPEEDYITYLFPLLRYHSRWQDLSAEDFKYLFQKKKISHNGYLMRVDTKPVTVVPSGKKLPDYDFGENSYKYLEKMTALCKEYNIPLVLIKSPSVYPYWYDQWNDQIDTFAKENDLLYINFLDHIKEMGIDFTTDTCDGGLHMNLAGAEKFTDFFGKILVDKFKLTDKRSDLALSQVWSEKADFYYAMKADQLKELKEYGYLKSYGALPSVNTSEETPGTSEEKR